MRWIPRFTTAATRSHSTGWTRYMSLGFELAAAVGGFTLLGWWIGNSYGKPRLGIIIGAVLGIVGGMYNLMRASLAAIRNAGRAKPEE